MGKISEQLINVVMMGVRKLLTRISWSVIPLHVRDASPTKTTGE